MEHGFVSLEGKTSWVYQLKYYSIYYTIIDLIFSLHSPKKLHNTYSNLCKASAIYVEHPILSIDAQISISLPFAKKNSKCPNSNLAAEQIKHQSALRSHRWESKVPNLPGYFRGPSIWGGLALLIFLRVEVALAGVPLNSHEEGVKVK